MLYGALNKCGYYSKFYAGISLGAITAEVLTNILPKILSSEP